MIGKKELILAVDAAKESLSLLGSALASEGFDLLSADSGESALAAIERQPPDLVLLDIRGKGIACLDFLRRFMATDKTKEIPVILLSAQADGQSRAEGLMLGAADYVVEPFRKEELLSRIRTQVALSEMKKELSRSAQELRESEERLQGILDKSSTLYFLKGLDGRYIAANRRFEDVFHVARGSIKGKTDHDIFPKEYADSFVDNDRKVLEAGRAIEMEEVVPQDDGTHTYISAKFPLYDRNGTPSGVCGLATDITDRKRAEEAWRESERQLMRSQEIAHLGSWRLDVATNQVVWTAELYAMYGYDPALPPPPYSEHAKLFAPESWERLSAAMANTVKTGIPYEMELQTVRKDGRHGWMWVRGEAIKDSGGKTVGLWGAAQDITERKLAEARLLASEQKYHTLFAQMDSGCALQEIIRDEAGNAVDYVTLEVNDSYGKILGAKREDVVGRKASEILPGDELRKWVGVFGGVALTGKPASYEMYSPVNDKYFEGNAFCPEPGRFVCIFSDITERKRAEEELKASNELLGLFIKESPIYAFIKSVSPAESKVLFASENYRDMVGIPGSEMIGKNMRELFPPEFAEKITADDNKVVSDGKSISLDEFLNERSYLTYKFPIKQGNRNLLAGYTIDVTERNKAEESLANMQKLESLGLLAGGIAHDFNNLLGGIYGYMDMAGEIATDRRVSQYISKAMSTIDRGRHLTQQLLTFSKGGAPIKSVAKLFPHVRETAQFALSGSNITCSFDVAEGLHACNFDKNQIAQVIDNIVINAKQAMPDGGKMEIAARNIAIGEGQHAVLGAGDYVKISIRDHGIGMPSEILTRIFDPFYTTKATGHGLGLASCYSIIKRHDGCIEVESEPGKGSVFHVFLPATAQDSERPETDPYGKHEGSGVFIVMDDEEIMRETMSDMLESFGYRAMCVEDGQEAVERLAAAMAGKKKVVGLILDLTIPGGMGGKEAIGEIKKINASIPVFVASGYAEDPVMANPREYGFMASIRKPFRKGDLAEMLNKHLGDAR